MSTLRSAPSRTEAPTGQEYREEMIRQAAYFRAQQRQRSRVELEREDWLAAEKEIDGMLTLRRRCP